MYLKSIKPHFKTYFINLLFLLIPISFVVGNLILNLNILLFITTAFIFYRTDIFKIKICLLDKLIIIFFSYAFLVGFFNTINSYYFENSSKNLIVIIKTISYLRFLIFYFVIRYLINKNLINLKNFFISSSLCSIFVSFDLIYQLSFGKDILGYTPVSPRVLSGPFGDEPIAGSYLQRFSLFLFFLFPVFFKIKNKNILQLISITFIILIIFASIIAGNRMPFILLILIMTLVILFDSNSRKYLISFIFFSLIIFSITFKFNSHVYVHFHNFLEKGSEIVTALQKGAKFQYPVFGTHYKEFYTGYETWKENKLFGGGIKSFKYNCSKKLINCGNHPHNYYLEILSDLGLIGFLILSIIFTKVLYDTFIKKYFFKSNLKHNHIITPFIFLFFAEIFPLKTTGSFFTTGNATYFFLIMALTIALSKEQNLN
tara:strand:+ start:133 stop:1419 length:1287 start_codon:yes stop_codon:yes gene_type:complete